MNIFGITKIRNEEKIIKDTLDHWSKICNGGIFVVDEMSTDNTVDICKKHNSVKNVQEIKQWDNDREKAEWFLRELGLQEAKKHAGPNDWFAYFDADERIFFNNWKLFSNKNIGAIRCRLYDVYITPEDKKIQNYQERKWVGPEFRKIIFFFRNHPELKYSKPDQREVTLPKKCKIVNSGIIKHFGKGISIEQWNETCHYYINHWPKYRDKWQKRLNKAVHIKSDFNNNLINFNDILSNKKTGFPLRDYKQGRLSTKIKNFILYLLKK